MTHADSAALDSEQWCKSRHSGGGNQCVEVAQIGATVAVRDSKNPGAGYLAFGADEWRSFLDDAKRGGYDL
jgi:hypothetical protein